MVVAFAYALSTPFQKFRNLQRNIGSLYKLLFISMIRSFDHTYCFAFVSNNSLL
nr:MAG TPA: hypothetical protein [Caudoviricetes sp.]